jgi:hypothetical protein
VCGAVLRLAATREGLDDDHSATAAGTWTRQHARLVNHCGLGYLRGLAIERQAARGHRQILGDENIKGSQSAFASAAQILLSLHGRT